MDEEEEKIWEMLGIGFIEFGDWIKCEEKVNKEENFKDDC